MSTTLSLRIVGGGKIQTVTLPPGVSRLGRDPGNDILIDDNAVSRQQATLEVQTVAAGRAGSPASTPPPTVRVVIAAGSPNGILRGGQISRELVVFPGEIFSIGPYRFELLATAELPVAVKDALAEDPAGHIDIGLVEHPDRIAPRWQRSRADDEVAAGASSRRARKSVVLLAFIALAGGFGGWYYLQLDDRPAQSAGLADSAQAPDPLAAIPKLECQGKDACLKRAQDAVKLAKQLRETGGHDLITVYKITKQLHRAYQTLGDDADRIPDLPSRYEQARTELLTMFSDLFFRYRQAKRNENLREQLGILKTIRPLCDEDQHRFCISLELSYRLLLE